MQKVTCFGISQCNIGEPLNTRRVIDSPIRIQDSTMTMVSIGTKTHITSYKEVWK